MIQKIIKTEGQQYKRHLIPLGKEELKILDVKEGDTVFIFNSSEIGTEIKKTNQKPEKRTEDKKPKNEAEEKFDFDEMDSELY